MAAATEPVMLHVDMRSDLVSTVVKFSQTALTTASASTTATSSNCSGTGTTAGPMVEKDIAQSIKTSLEREIGGCWHIAVGTSYGASISHDNNCCVLFRIGKTHVLAFQTFDDSSLVLSKEGAAAAPKPRRAEGKRDDDEEES